MSQYGQASFNAVIESLTGNAGGAVFSTAGNVNILGAVGITVTGTPATSTLTISGAGFAGQFNTDAGNAAPAAGIIIIAGGTNIATAGAANTVQFAAAFKLFAKGQYVYGTALVVKCTHGVKDSSMLVVIKIIGIDKVGDFNE